MAALKARRTSGHALHCAQAHISGTVKMVSEEKTTFKLHHLNLFVFGTACPVYLRMLMRLQNQH